MKRITGILVGLLLLLLCACAAADVAINEANFPDGAFRDYVKGFDKDGSGVLTSAELNTVTEISLEGEDYSSLQGVEFFPVLQKLTFIYTNINSPDLSKNKLLQEIDCHYNYNLYTLNLTGNTALKSLRCDGNHLGALDLRKNTALETLKCDTMNSQDFAPDFSGCRALKTLDISNAFQRSLDLRPNRALVSVDCDGNMMENLRVDGLTSLETLHCEQNNLSTLDVSGLYNLRELNCYGCALTSLKLDGCTAMDNLSCSGNQLTELDVSHCDFLTVLDCSMNQLKTLDLSSNFILKGLEVWDNNINELDISWTPNLEDAYQKGTKDEFMRNIYRYSYNGSWLTINDGQKVKTSDSADDDPEEPEAQEQDVPGASGAADDGLSRIYQIYLDRENARNAAKSRRPIPGAKPEPAVDNGSIQVEPAADGEGEAEPKPEPEPEPQPRPDPYIEPEPLDPSAEAFVTHCYRTALGREPDAEGLNKWARELMRSSRSARQIARSFALSGEAASRNLSNAEYVTMLYALFMGRTPDEAGLQAWLMKLDAGEPRESVADGFVNAGECASFFSSFGF